MREKTIKIKCYQIYIHVKVAGICLQVWTEFHITSFIKVKEKNSNNFSHLHWRQEDTPLVGDCLTYTFWGTSKFILEVVFTVPRSEGSWPCLVKSKVRRWMRKPVFSRRHPKEGREGRKPLPSSSKQSELDHLTFTFETWSIYPYTPHMYYFLSWTSLQLQPSPSSESLTQYHRELYQQANMSLPKPEIKTLYLPFVSFPDSLPTWSLETPGHSTS